MRHHTSTFLALITCTVLGACAASYAPVVDVYGGGSKGAPVTRGVHVVRQGETLYSIAWRYGWDFKQLASANRIAAPYTIYPGQQIRLDRVATNTRTAPASKPSSTSTTSRTGTQSSSTSKPATTTSSTSKPSSTSSAPKPTVATGPVRWQWPATGAVITKFSSSNVGQSGIAIDGNDGDPVRAAADGVVVYRGDGLTGYGNLLIIKHSERWLSAYAHNKTMQVKEGQAVKAGQQVASMGATGTFRTQLHFEVRRDGSPIDPMTVLPGR